MDEKLFVVVHVETGAVIAVFSNQETAETHSHDLAAERGWTLQVTAVPFNPPPF